MRDRRKHLTLLALIVAALVGALMLAVPGSPAHRSATLGLDLKGGLEVVLQAQKVPGHPLTSADLDTAVSIMRQRIDDLGVTEPEIRKQEPNQIVIQLAGVHDPNKAAKLIGQTAVLELYDLEGDLHSPSIDTQGNPVAFTTRYALLAPAQSLAKTGKPTEYYLFGPKKNLIAGPSHDEGRALRQRGTRSSRRARRSSRSPQGLVLLTCGGDDAATGQSARDRTLTRRSSTTTSSTTAPRSPART